MTEQDRANALVTVLTKLTLGNVALGLALTAGAVLVWGQVYEIKAGAVTLLVATIVGCLLVSIGATMWSKLEAMQMSADARWQQQVDALHLEIEDMRKRADEGAVDRAQLHKQLAACLERDLASQARDRVAQKRMAEMEKKLATLGERSSDFGDLGG
jgi:hypothetical protein